MSDLDDMDVVDENGQCTRCGRFVGDGEHECSAPGGPACVLNAAQTQAILYGPIEVARAIHEAANEPPDDGELPLDPRGDTTF